MKGADMIEAAVAAMKPGSPVWNQVAFRSDFERRALSYWPQTFKTWFGRTEKELLNSHDFRGVMLEYASIDEWWRIGELRWNRKLWFPYVRMLQYSIAPILGLLFYIRFTNKPGSPGTVTSEEWEKEYQDWKHMLKSGDADEYYMIQYNESKLFTKRAEPTQFKPKTGDELVELQKRTWQGQADQMAMSRYGKNTGDKGFDVPKDPY